MLQFHAPRQDEINKVIDFMNACDVADFGQPDSDIQDLQEQWSEIDLDKDAWIACAGDSILGYSCLAPGQNRVAVDLYVHKDLTPAGRGVELIALAEKRVRQRLEENPAWHPAYLVGYAIRTNTEASAAFEQNGFQLHTYQFQMRCDLDRPIDPPQWPEGFTLRPYQSEDETELYNLICSTFTWPGHTMTPLEDWRSALFRGGRFDPDLFITVWFENRLVGAALSYDEAERGWIRQLAVAKELQGQGLGSLLLKHMFFTFQKRGASYAALGVASENIKARGFYERAGMYCAREFAEYHKDLAA